MTRVVREKKSKQVESARVRNLSNMEARSKYFQLVQEKKFGPTEKEKKMVRKAV